MEQENMTSYFRGTVTIMAIAASATTAFADCTLEVHQAFTRQSNTDMVRKEMNLIGEQGPFTMTVEYVKPDRMRQVVKPLVEPEKATETVLIGNEAWTKTVGGDWQKLDSTTTDQIVSFFKSTFANVPQNVGSFECMGAETVEGQKVRTYKGLDEPKQKTQEQLEAEKRGDTVEEPKNEALRVIYLNVDTGLPARIVFAREGMLDKPIFKEVYTYPTDLKIEKPATAKP
jgi:hypothetical protein